MKKTIVTVLVIIALIIIVIQATNKESVEPIPRNDLQADHSYESDLSLITDGTYHVDTNESSVVWTGRGIGKSHTGTIMLADGDVIVSDGTLTGTMMFDMNSIISDNHGLDNDLRSANFFKTETHPISTFIIHQYVGGVLEGDLTINGITQPVSFPRVDVNNVTTSELHLIGTVEIDRTLWDITFRSASIFSDIGDKAINDIVTLDVDVVANLNVTE